MIRAFTASFVDRLVIVDAAGVAPGVQHHVARQVLLTGIQQADVVDRRAVLVQRMLVR